jgi:hypothetical protein
VFCNINRTVVLDKDRTMDNVQEHNVCITVPSSQTFRSYWIFLSRGSFSKYKAIRRRNSLLLHSSTRRMDAVCTSETSAQSPTSTQCNRLKTGSILTVCLSV